MPSLRDFVSPVRSADKVGRIYLFYSIQACGKTYTAMTGAGEASDPNGREMFLFDTELRAMTKKDTCFPTRKINIIEPYLLDDIVQVPELEGIDDSKTVSRLMTGIIAAVKESKSWTGVKPIIVIDSMTEVWKIIQAGGKRRLASEAKVNMHTFALNTQFDWYPITAVHDKLMLFCRMLTQQGCDVILTARAEWVPSYVKDATKDTYYQCQKGVPFTSDVIIQLRRTLSKEGDMIGNVVAHIEKIGDESIIGMPKLTNPTFAQIKALAEKTLTERAVVKAAGVPKC